MDIMNKGTIITAEIIDDNCLVKTIRCENCESPYFTEMTYQTTKADDYVSVIDYECAVCKKKLKMKFRPKIKGNLYANEVNEQFQKDRSQLEIMKKTIIEMKEFLSTATKTLDEMINFLYSRKNAFYGDFYYSEKLQNHPDLINEINLAIAILEQAEKKPDSTNDVKVAISYLQKAEREIDHTFFNYIK
jgi:hypothetical protein